MYFLKANIEHPMTFLSAGHFTADNKWQHNERISSSYELILCLRGPIYMQQEETQYVLNSGEVLLLLPGVTHKGYASSEKGVSFYWMHFQCTDASLFKNDRRIITDISLTNNNPFFSGLSDSVLIPTFLKAPNFDRLTVSFNQLLHLSQVRYYTPHSTHYMVTSLLIELSEQTLLKSKDQRVEAKPTDKFQRILEWIRIHMHQQISLQDVAFEFNYSREYLSRLFKKRMGMTLNDYVNNLKIAKAKELLCSSDRSIKEIAGDLGFVDDKYFMKLFRSYENTTAKHYRNAYHMTFLNNR